MEHLRGVTISENQDKPKTILPGGISFGSVLRAHQSLIIFGSDNDPYVRLGGSVAAFPIFDARVQSKFKETA